MTDALLLSLYRWHRARPLRRHDAKGRPLLATACTGLASARAEIERHGRRYMAGLMAARTYDEMEGRNNG